MRKIKKFKIPIYSYEILRKSRKAGADLRSVGLDNDRDFKEYVSQLASAIEPAVVFGYFPTDDPDTAVLSYRDKKPLTIAMLTLGNAIYEKTCDETDEARKTVNITAVVRAVLHIFLPGTDKIKHQRRKKGQFLHAIVQH